jgi:hypothetical protein
MVLPSTSGMLVLVASGPAAEVGGEAACGWLVVLTTRTSSGHITRKASRVRRGLAALSSPTAGWTAHDLLGCGLTMETTNWWRHDRLWVAACLGS